MDETDKNNIIEEPKTSGMAIASVVLPISVLAIYILHSLGLQPPLTTKSGYILLFACFITGLVLAITSFIRIALSRKKMTGKKLAVSGIIINTFLVYITVYAFISDYKLRITRDRLCCAANMHRLGMAIFLYASENSNKYPLVDKWCDLIMPYTDDDNLFRCGGSDTVRGESSYALNKNLSGKKLSEIPRGTVILFETNFGKHPAGRDGLLLGRDCNELTKYAGAEDKVYKLRWNQTGGLELLTTDNHRGKGCNVLLSAPHGFEVEFIESQDLNKLRWKNEKLK